MVDKFLGDGMLVHFGALSISKTYAADCLNAIEEINHKMTAWSQKKVRT